MNPNPDTGDAVKVSSLRALREAAGMSLRAAAEAIGVHHSTLGRYEDGTYEPQATELVALAATYKVTTETVIQAVLDGRREKA